MRTLLLIAVVLTGAGCSLYLGQGDDGDDDIGDPPLDDPPCVTPNPGCESIQECATECGDTVYRCEDGEWVTAVQCDTCLGGAQPFPAIWYLTLSLYPDQTCGIELPTELEVYADIGPEGYRLTLEDSTLSLIWSWRGAGGGSPNACSEADNVMFQGVVPRDGEPQPIEGTWDLVIYDEAGGQTIDGWITGTAGMCTLGGAIRGRWQYAVPI